MNKICNLSYDEFKTYGEVKEGFPHYEENLIAYYPFDKDTKNIIPEVELYVENNQIKIDGLKKNNAITSKGTTIENGMIKFAGNASSYMAINTDIFNSDKTYRIEVEYQTTKNNRDECILFIGNKDTINPYYNLWNNGSLQQTSLRRMNDNEKFSIEASKVGDSIPNKINKATIYVRKENLIMTYINDRFAGMHVNTMDKKPSVIYPLTDNNYFSGYIKSITINTFDDLNTNENNIEVYDCGYISGQAKTNVGDNDCALYAVTWTPGENIFFEKTKRLIYGMPIYDIRIKPTTPELLDRVKNSAWSCGIIGKTVSLEPNQDCCSFLLYRPLTFKDSAKVNGQPSNNINWVNGKTVDLENGWKLAYKYRGNGGGDAQSDGVHWSFYTPEIELNEELVIECSPVITMKDTQVPTLLSFLSGQSKGTNIIDCNPKIINDNINEFSLSYEWIPFTHTTDYFWANQLWLGDWTQDISKDWIGLFYRGRGWEDANVAHCDCHTKINNKFHGLSIIKNFSELLGHKIKVVLSYKKSEKTLRALAYDKTTNKTLASVESNEIEFSNFDNFYVNKNTNDLMKNLCIFNRSFTMDEMLGMCRKDFKILEDGSFNVDNLYEEIAFNKKNSYYVPLDADTVSLCGRLDVANANNLFDISTIVDGYIYDDGLVKPPLNADFTSDYIPVKENEKYIFEVLKNTKENTPAVAWFDNKKALIKRDIKTITADNKWIVTSPDKARFARITSRWKNEVKLIFKEKEHSKINSTYQKKDGGIIAGEINYKALFNLTPVERAPKFESTQNNILFDADSLIYPSWSQGFNSGVGNPTEGYHAKWVNEGPRRNSCMKFINHNSIIDFKGRWLGMNYTISDLLNPIGIVHGDRINISFMAKSDVDGSILQLGIHRRAISTNQNAFNKLYDISLTTYWKEYSIEIPVDNDWTINGYAALYFYGNILDKAGESIKWVSDVYMMVNGPDKIYPSCIKAINSTPIEYNLTESIGIDWSKPWHISFWRKGLAKSRGQYNYNVWSLGSINNISSDLKGYIYSGILYDNKLTNSINSKTLDDEQNNKIEEDNYFDNWIFYTISYDGTKITLRTRGEKIYSELIKNINITRTDYFKDNAQEADLFLTTCTGSYSNNSAVKDLLILKNETFTKAQEDEMFRTLIRSTHNLNTRIIISEE